MNENDENEIVNLIKNMNKLREISEPLSHIANQIILENIEKEIKNDKQAYEEILKNDKDMDFYIEKAIELMAQNSTNTSTIDLLIKNKEEIKKLFRNFTKKLLEME